MDFDLSHLRVKKIIVLIASGVFLILLAVFSYFFALTPKSNIKSNTTITNYPLNAPIVIKFDRPVDRNQLQLNITPDIPGHLAFSDNIFGKHLFKTVNFIPDKFFTPNQKYHVNLKNISSIYNVSKAQVLDFDIETQSIPTIQKANISDGEKDVPINKKIEIFLSETNNDVANFNFKLSPNADIAATLDQNNQSYTIVPESDLDQGVEYTLSATREIKLGNKIDSDNYQWQIKFTTKNPSAIESYSPNSGQVLTSTKQFVINFGESMKRDSINGQITISPALSGSWSWENDKKLIFNISEALKFNTTYSFTLNNKIYDTNGGFIPFPTTLKFTTIGPITVSSTFPKNKASGATVGAEIWISFNQAVDKSSAQSLFSISPSVAGLFRWQDNKMYFKPDVNLAKDTSYNIKLHKGIKSINGQDSQDDYSFSFSTETNEVSLNVPMDYQDKPLSCEATSLKMGLLYKGANVSENDIMNIIGYDPTVRNGDVWGDPYEAFVGDINGHQDSTGYGVYWGPIAKAASHWRNVRVVTGMSASELASELTAGNPVIVWGTYGSSSYQDNWHTPGGKLINAWKGEHARVATGFIGSVDNPQYFLLNDPVAGKIKWTKNQLLDNWGRFGNSGVVVY